jgi:hypothetical protein
MEKYKSKPIALLAMLMLWACLVQAQEYTTASGGNATGSGGTVTYSVGQVVYTTQTSAAGSVAQGVQQPYEIQLPLPIELLSFTGSCQGNSVELRWTTATETNNDYFTICRSIDGINFNDIEKVAGAGNSSQPLNYSFSDKKPYMGTAYYRLKQTDIDGAFKYSTVVVTKCSDAFSDVIVYPNPTSDFLTLIVGKLNLSRLHVELYDNFGKLIEIKKINSAIEMIHLENLPDATYFLKVTQNNREVKTLKIIKK